MCLLLLSCLKIILSESCFSFKYLDFLKFYFIFSFKVKFQGFCLSKILWTHLICWRMSKLYDERIDIKIGLSFIYWMDKMIIFIDQSVLSFLFGLLLFPDWSVHNNVSSPYWFTFLPSFAHCCTGKYLLQPEISARKRKKYSI